MGIGHGWRIGQVPFGDKVEMVAVTDYITIRILFDNIGWVKHIIIAPTPS